MPPPDRSGPQSAGSRPAPVAESLPASPRSAAAEPRGGAGEGPELAASRTISVVVPVRNDPGNLEICLTALEASEYRDFEVIVVDDASTDDTPEVARRHRVRLIRQPARTGPAAARNRGARAARGPYLFLLDADVRVQPETLGRVAAHFQAAPEVEAFFGSYDARPGAPNFVSQFRNLLHHHVHQVGNEEASTFWSGCGAIKRSLFLELGGFDVAYDKASIEDIELGSRLRRAGHRIVLVKDIQVTHMKRWSLWRMVECDVRKRGVPWTLLVLRQGRIPNDLNLRYGQRFSAAMAAGLVADLALAPWLPVGVWAPAASILLLGIVVLNLRFYRLLLEVRGLLFSLRALPLHILYYLTSGLAFGIGLLVHLGRRLRPDPG